MQVTENCQNCHKPFPQSKIHSHFAYCRRNIRKCSECSQMVDINHLEEHMEEQHSKLACEFCAEEFPQREIDAHRKRCDAKPVVCAYCEQTVPVVTFEEHQIGCGARTKLCGKCQKSIMLREFDLHEATCEGMPTPATVRAYTNYNDYLKKQREQLGMPQQQEIKPPKPIEKVRVTAKDLTVKEGESPTLKHTIKELGTRVAEVKAPRLHGTGEIGYFGGEEDEEDMRYYAPHPSGGRVVSTTVTTRIDGKVVSSNTYPASTYQGGLVPTYPISSTGTKTVTYQGTTYPASTTTTYAPTKTSVQSTTYPSAPSKIPTATTTPYHGFQDQDAELQRALMQSLGYM